MNRLNPLSLAATFKDVYGASPRVFSAPGRVNLIGEHTDYNEGFVLPIAINRRTYVAACPRQGTMVRVGALDLDDSAEFDLRNADLKADQRWLAYVAGVAWILERDHRGLCGADLMVSSNVPIGAGLSSSAALEVAVGQALTALSGIDVDPLILALAAQQAENTFAGARVGMMDQLASMFGKREHAMLIDCRSLEIRQIPTNKIEATIVVCNTRVKHELASSAYNQRRNECEAAVTILKNKIARVTSLRDVSVADFEEFQSDLPDPIRGRTRHVVTENQRTLEAAEAFERGDVQELGRLMKLSHESLRDDYEVSCHELDVMVELAWEHPGVFGARMTGGGFGGCTVNLVARSQVEDFTDYIRQRYRQTTRLEPDLFVVQPDDGLREDRSSKN